MAAVFSKTVRARLTFSFAGNVADCPDKSVSSSWLHLGGHWARCQNGCNGRSREELQSHCPITKKGRSYSDQEWDLPLLEASVVLRLLLVGTGHTDLARQSHLLLGICSHLVEILFR